VALFASQGLEVERSRRSSSYRGRSRRGARERRGDALYTHTPFLESASWIKSGRRGESIGCEVRELAGGRFHVLAVTRALERSQPGVVRALVAAIAHAEALVHADADAATDAVLHALPSRDRAHVERIVSIYASAVPRTPRVSASAIAVSSRSIRTGKRRRS